MIECRLLGRATLLNIAESFLLLIVIFSLTLSLAGIDKACVRWWEAWGLGRLNCVSIFKGRSRGSNFSIEQIDSIVEPKTLVGLYRFHICLLKLDVEAILLARRATTRWVVVEKRQNLISLRRSMVYHPELNFISVRKLNWILTA